MHHVIGQLSCVILSLEIGLTVMRRGNLKVQSTEYLWLEPTLSSQKQATGSNCRILHALALLITDIKNNMGGKPPKNELSQWAPLVDNKLQALLSSIVHPVGFRDNEGKTGLS